MEYEGDFDDNSSTASESGETSNRSSDEDTFEPATFQEENIFPHSNEFRKHSGSQANIYEYSFTADESEGDCNICKYLLLLLYTVYIIHVHRALHIYIYTGIIILQMYIGPYIIYISTACSFHGTCIKMAED